MTVSASALPRWAEETDVIPIRILLVDDHRPLCEAVRTLLEETEEFEVVGTATDGQSAVALARELHPDVVVMDVVLPKVSGISATRQIKAERPDTQVIGLSVYSDRHFVEGMSDAEASAYVLKDDVLPELPKAIWAVKAGETYFDPRLSTRTIESENRGQGPVSGTRSITATAAGASLVHFALEAPEARTVLLVGDFTGWQDRPVAMAKGPAGWHTAQWLEPGTHEYRFLVDGSWRNPDGVELVANDRFGYNAVVEVG